VYKGYYCTNSLSIEWSLRKNTSLRLRDIGDVDTRITNTGKIGSERILRSIFLPPWCPKEVSGLDPSPGTLGRKRTRLRKRSAPGSETPYTSPCSSDKWRSYENLDN